MLAEVTFAMDTDSDAPYAVGSMLVPHAHRFVPRWFHRGERTYVTLQVGRAIANGLVQQLTPLHPSIRCIDLHDVVVHPAG